MGKDNKKPDSLTRKTEFVVAPSLSPWLEKTVIKKGGDTFTGYGWTREEADKNAGDRFRKGAKDKH